MMKMFKGRIMHSSLLRKVNITVKIFELVWQPIYFWPAQNIFTIHFIQLWQVHDLALISNSKWHLPHCI